ncbi:bifunctional diguanylate cyclase/phosphodiesterase [Beggiatoa leptomitoformis]|uniref:cyclic-guanylate-specific phosphodiesterase n=1 Tax=Beggiatoa leptomitoformis TaxID=288004 RepID=A0A2N9YE79_9GAMM|nr:EAL domain-containing protein [Beggiatoa leptomitoformis]AUI68787.1 EAL domain-containing protein [Beggiatoa leptomitoformis]QGX03797.1 EAL domain-containing protein [Beggiatoa leptomitoformis]
MRLKLSTRLILGVVIIEIFMLSLLVWNSVRLINSSHAELLEQSVRRETDLLAYSLAIGLAYQDRATLQDVLHLLENAQNLVYVIVFNWQGQVMAKIGHPPAIEQLPRIDNSYLEAKDDGVFDVEKPVILAEQVLGTVRIGYSLASVESITARTRLQNTSIALLELFLSIGVTVLIGILLVRRLRHLETGAKALYNGEFQHRILLQGADEMTDLAQTFNALAHHLEKTQAALNIEQTNLLRESSRLNSLLTGIRGVVWEINPQTQNIIYVSPFITKLLGFTIEQCLKKGFLIHKVHVDERKKLQHISRGLIADDTFMLDYRVLNGAGKWLWLRNIGIIERDAQHQPINVLGIAWDISENKQLLEQVHQAKIVFDNTNEGIIITDAQQRITLVNKACSEITGYSTAEIVGKTPRILHSGRQDKLFYQQLWSMLEQIGRWQGEIWNKHKDGTIYPCWESINVVKNERGEVIHYIAIFSDITSIKNAERQLEHLAHHDLLTDLPNRLYFNTRLEQAIVYAKQQQEEIAVLFLDLDRFKNVNDTLGHIVGDQVLQVVSRRLRACLRPQDTLARLGGDEFILLMTGTTAVHKQAITIAQRLLNTIQQAIHINQHEIVVTGSVGISIYPDDSNEAQSLVKYADIAMYRAKSLGNNQYCFYTSQLTTEIEKRFSLENDLRHAIEQEKLQLYYQPKIDLQTGKIIGAEALIRWQHPQHGFIPPDVFIPLAGETGLIESIDRWVMFHACQQNKQWQDEYGYFLSIAVNLSNFINHDNLSVVLKRCLKQTQIDPAYLELEITEGFVMQNVESAMTNLKAFKELGVRLSIDDFGTGYSSLSYLKQLPLNALKIDRSFIQDIPNDPDDVAIVQTIINLAHNLHLSVIAEGIENQAQLDFLRHHQCDEGQGYLFSKAVKADEFLLLLQKNNHFLQENVQTTPIVRYKQ